MSATIHRDSQANESSAPVDRPYPQDGDVVVTREAHSRVHYTVRQLPGIVQFSAAVRDEAVRLAGGFGNKFAVDVWYCEGGTYRLLEAHRPQTLTRPDVQQVADLESEDSLRDAVRSRNPR